MTDYSQLMECRIQSDRFRIIPETNNNSILTIHPRIHSLIVLVIYFYCHIVNYRMVNVHVKFRWVALEGRNICESRFFIRHKNSGLQAISQLFLHSVICPLRHPHTHTQWDRRWSVDTLEFCILLNFFA